MHFSPVVSSWQLILNLKAGKFAWTQPFLTSPMWMRKRRLLLSLIFERMHILPLLFARSFVVSLLFQEAAYHDLLPVWLRSFFPHSGEGRWAEGDLSTIHVISRFFYTLVIYVPFHAGTPHWRTREVTGYCIWRRRASDLTLSKDFK